MLSFALVCTIPSFLIAVAATALMRRIAPKIGLLDQPAARKVHATPTPLGGGVGIVLGVTIPIGLGLLAAANANGFASQLPESIASLLGGVGLRSKLMLKVLIAAVVIAAVGLWDDARGLGWRVRLFMQVGAAIWLVASGVQATVFVDALWVGQVVTVVWIVGLINAFNFLDNMDALSAGIGCIAATIFAIVMLIFSPEPRWLVGGAMLTIAGATAGFLVHNRPPASIFMGDAGSTFLGLMMAVLTVTGTFYADETTGRHVLLAPLCVLAVPIYDTLTVVAIRLKEGRSPFQPDKKHFSHRLVELGLTKPAAVLTIHLATLTTGLGALLLYRLHSWGEATVVLAIVGCVLSMTLILETAGRRARRSDKARFESKAEETRLPEDNA